jgi:Cu+-exporting ATPase
VAKNNVNTSLKDVNIGDTLISRVGDIIPLDGVVVSGEASINEATITGEAMAIDKFVDSTVISGTLVLDGVITYKVTSTKESSTITQITKRVIEAANSKPKIEKLADRISLYFVPAVILISIITFIIWMIISKDFSTSFNYAVSVLVISCPCALGLATPVAVMVASGVGAKNNLLFKDSEVLEKLSTIDVILLDKTGTITNGVLEVVDYKTTILDSDFFRILYALEVNSTHPLALSICKYAKNFTFDEAKVAEYSNKIGYGISGVIDGVKYYCGNSKYLEYLDITNPYSDIKGVGLYLFNNKEVLGYVSLKDEINKNSIEAINYWHKNKISVAVLTGDTLENANNILSSVNVDQIYASLLPEEKEKIVSNYLEKGYNVMMIGDGINDSIALSKATIGVAIATGTDVAANSSDLVLAKHNLMDVVNAISLGKMTFRIIKENLFWALIYNVIGIPIAAGVLSSLGITLTPMIASLCMSFSSLFVVSNALRINGFRRKEIENMFEMKISVPSMMCKHCEARVIDCIKKISNVKDCKVDLKKKTVLIKSVSEINFNDVANLLKQAGYDSTLLK